MNLKNKISDSFSSKAKDYDQNAILQKSIAEKLIKFSEEEIKNSVKILDFGCGTGFLAKSIKAKFAKENFEKNITQSDISPEMCRIASAYGEVICSDFDNLPFEEENFDMIISSCALQWSLNLERTFSGLYKILKNNGKVAFSIFGQRTFEELKNFPVNKFLSLDEIEKILKNCGFKNIKTEREIYTENISLKKLFDNMKNIGANVNVGNNKLTKSNYKELQKNYNNQVTWEVYYIKATK